MIFADSMPGGQQRKMQSVQSIDYQQQIDDALKKAKPKKVLYLYDEFGYKRLLGVFEKKKASEIKRYLRSQKLINRLTENDIVTTEPDDTFTQEQLS